MVVLVRDKGYAGSSQPITFNYVMEIVSVEPRAGSMAGGSLLTIHGSGFGNNEENASVILDGSPCEIVTINSSHITCETSSHSEGTVNLTVTIQDGIAVLEQAFEYNSSLTPNVTSVKPQKGNVAGKEVLIISGSGFNMMLDARVKLGVASCAILNITDSEICCLTPPHETGKLQIRIYIPDKGFANMAPSHDMFEYVLFVRSISPLVGSFAGGTLLTLMGQGFASKETNVKIDGRTCHVTKGNSSHVLCKTAGVFKMIQVKNSGHHRGKCTFYYN